MKANQKFTSCSILPLSYPPKRGVLEGGWEQVGISHFYEKFSILLDTTVRITTIAPFRLRLDNSKLKLLHHELRVHDKEELALKKIKSEDGDNEGLREAEVRYLHALFSIQSFINITVD